jgi:hypothetical protein
MCHAMRRQRSARPGRGGYTLPAVNTGTGPGAYRDERSALAAENARLSAELAELRGARRSTSRRLAIAALIAATDVAVFTMVIGWVNAPRDAIVWLGWCVAALTVAGNVFAAQRALRSQR